MCMRTNAGVNTVPAGPALYIAGEEHRMPNWIEGSLRLRGTADNLERFFREGFDAVSYFGETRPNPVVVDMDEGYVTVRSEETAWIKNTRRAFVNNLDLAFEIPEDPEEIRTVAIPVKQAWCFDTDNWKKISTTFHIDLRLYGFEQGQEFEQEIEIINGEVTVDHEIEYDDYVWESKMPILGG